MSEITVGGMIELLSGYPEDAVLHFEELDFYRLKIRGEKLLQVEFNEKVYED
jgi:hypothetical protein